MKKSDVYEIAIKLLGLYLFFTSFDVLRDVMTTIVVISTIGAEVFENVSETMFFTVSIANFIFIVLFGLILTFRTKPIVRLLCKQSDFEESTQMFVDRKIIYEIAFVIVGLVLIAWTLPHLLVQLKNQIPLELEERRSNWFETNVFIVSSIKVVMGIASVFFAKRLSSLFARSEE
jgi:hypothetical protein